MSFQPLITLTSVARDNNSFVTTDATVANNISGWGSPNAPSGPMDITSLFSQVQAYGGLPVNSSISAGSVSTTMTFQNTIRDGVNTYVVYYGLVVTLTNLTISTDRMTLLSTDSNLLNLFDGVKAVSLDGVNFPVLVSSVQAGSITLVSPIPGTLSSTTIFKYFIATVQALTINNGEGICVNGISLLPIEANSCDNAMPIFNNLMLKLAAEIAFNCGNLSKAHEAANLLSGNKPPVTNNCTSCG